MRVCLFQPEIPQNTGTLLRLGACMGIGIDIIEPCGFIFDDKKLRRAGMDYLEKVDYKTYPSWDSYLAVKPESRLIALSGKATETHLEMFYEINDILVLGSEGPGLPQKVMDQILTQVRIPMVEGTRSLNVAIAGAMVLNEAMRQTNLFPCVTPMKK